MTHFFSVFLVCGVCVRTLYVIQSLVTTRTTWRSRRYLAHGGRYALQVAMGQLAAELLVQIPPAERNADTPKIRKTKQATEGRGARWHQRQRPRLLSGRKGIYQPRTWGTYLTFPVFRREVGRRMTSTA
ncbi:hypothetical protein EDB87DRAFT_690265 [Lactarius vividus]|nr:hypothetical protein EDB87DRAFT_690265 [Lactarius vividus]